MIETLSSEQQQVLTLKFVFNFSNAEAGDDPRQDRGRDQVAPAPRARLAPEAAHAARRLDGARGRHRRPAECGQDDPVQRDDEAPRSPPRASPTRRTSAWPRSRTSASTAGGGRRREEGDSRGGAGRRRPRHRPGAAREPAPGRRAARRRRRLLGGRDPARDLENLELELLVADRDHVERRLERVEKQAKSGDTKLRAEVAELEKVLAHLDAGGVLRDYPGELPPSSTR